MINKGPSSSPGMANSENYVYPMHIVAPDIAAAHKIILSLWKKNKFLALCSFRGKYLVWKVATWYYGH
jgi:hypothetical protein